MASQTQAFNFINRVYREVWQPYDAKALGKYYDLKLKAHSLEESFCFSDFYELLKCNAEQLSHMQVQFHRVIVDGCNNLVAWFTTSHFGNDSQKIYHLQTMANYQIKGDKIIQVEFMWDKPTSFVMNQASQLQTISNPKIGKTLSKRETQCFLYSLKGYSAKLIANKLKLSTRTVETHLNNIKYKLDLANSREIIDFAFAMGYLHFAPLLATFFEE